MTSKAGSWALVLLLGAAVAWAPASVSAQHPLSTLPAGDPAYTQLLGLERQGCAPARVSDNRPYHFGDLRQALIAAASDGSCDGVILTDLRARFDSTPYVPADSTRPAFGAGGSITVRGTALNKSEYRPLAQDVREASFGDPPLVGVLRGRATWDGGPQAFAVSEAYFQTNGRNDPLVREKGLRDNSAVLGMSEAYLAVQTGKLGVSLGRVREVWGGEGEESLVLSGAGPPIDRLALSATWRTFEARAILAMLNDVELTAKQDSIASTRSILYHRFVAGHILTWKPSRFFELSLGETMLFSRYGGLVDIGFANPLMPLVVTQNDSARNATSGVDNLTVYGALRFRPGRATVTTELLVDDIQIDAADRRRTPDQLGWRLHGALPIAAPLPMAVSAEYRHVNSYTYVRRFFNEAYQNYGRPLGSELGPDADLARGEAELWLNGRLRVAAGVSRWRHGVLRVDDRPGHDLNGHAGEPFPSTSLARPAVQTATLGDFTIHALDVRLPVTARIELASISNVNNKPAPAALFVRAHLSATYAFRYP
ncbi:MAG: hypothetical protein NVS1B4_08160 [Gemmatimonadaceae bacterium]